MTVIVTASGGNDAPALQAALNAGGRVRYAPATIGGWGYIASMVTLPANNTVLQLDCNITAATGAAAAFRVVGAGCRVMGRDWFAQINGSGMGIECGQAGVPCGKPIIDMLQINTLGAGINFVTGSGAYVGRIQFNGTPGAAGYCMRFMEWDTVQIEDIQSEDHDHGIRVGWSQGNVSNLQFGKVMFDRLHPSSGIGLWVEAAAGGVHNLQFGSLWASQGNYPIALNGATGPVNNVQIANGYYTGFVNKNAALSGTVTNFQRANEIHA